MKNILVINSLRKIDQSLLGIFRDLGGNNSIFGWLADNVFLNKFKEIGLAEKIFFGPKSKGAANLLVFICLLPIFFIIYFLKLYFFSHKQKIGKIVCVSFPEKIIFTPLADLLKIRVFWVELPGATERRGKVSQAFLKIFSGPAEIITFTLPDAIALAERGFNKERINNISLGVNLQAVEHQDNIFYSLAKADKPYSFYKNFTVGAVASALDRRRLEILIQAAKNCLNFIPNLRLVIIGAVSENSNLNWLVKKMGMEARVWFVGEQKNPLQWFLDFDLYVALQENPGLSDLETALMAASKGVPLMAFPEKNMSDIIIAGQTGFWLEKDSAESLGQKIVEIEADQLFCRAIGEKGKKMVHDHFDRNKQIKRLEEVINRGCNIKK